MVGGEEQTADFNFDRLSAVCVVYSRMVISTRRLSFRPGGR